MHRSSTFLTFGRGLLRPLTLSKVKLPNLESVSKVNTSMSLDQNRYQSTQSIPNQARRYTLKDQIIQKIKFTGPITIHEYMRSVLTSPNSVSHFFNLILIFDCQLV